MKLRRVAIFAAGYAGSIFWIAPAVGAFNYTIVGVLVGMAALVAATIILARDHVPVMINAASSLILGWLCGVFWPMAAVSAFLWLTAPVTVSKPVAPEPDA